MKFEEPEVNGTALILVTFMFAMLFGAIAFGAWAYFRETEIEPPVVTHLVDEGVVMDEGLAKAVMIFELTGRDFPPEIAKWADITFSGTSVTIDTEKLNVWLGRNWQSK